MHAARAHFPLSIAFVPYREWEECPLKTRSAIAAGGLLVIEQGALSAGNFFAVILVARHISPAEFGIFAGMQSALWVAQSVYSALVLEPMTVLAPIRYHNVRQQYFRMLSMGHTLCAVLVAATCAPLLWITVRGPTRESIVTLGIFLVSVPAVLCLWLVRRASQIEYQPRRSALAGLLYAATTLSLVEALTALRLLTHLTAFAAIALASVVAALPMAITLIGCRTRAPQDLRWGDLLSHHWQFGRWELIAGLCQNIAAQIPLLVLAGTGQLESAGALRAIQALVSPILLIMPPATAVMIPKVAQHLRTGDTQKAEQTARHLATAMTAVAVVYTIILSVCSTQLEHLAYGGKYRDAAWLIAPLALCAVIAALTLGPYVSMRAACWAQCNAIITAATLMVALASIPMINLFGLPGAVAVSLATSVAGSGATVVAYRYFRRRRRLAAAEGERKQHSFIGTPQDFA